MTGHSRHYMAHRRAWYPRLWPVLVPACLLTVALGLWLRPATLASIALGVGIGVVAMQARLMIWRRRHPVITPGQYIEDLQRKARWN